MRRRRSEDAFSFAPCISNRVIVTSTVASSLPCSETIVSTVALRSDSMYASPSCAASSGESTAPVVWRAFSNADFILNDSVGAP